MSNAVKLVQEANFFDRWADENIKHLKPVEPQVIERYRNPGLISPKEYCFRLLGDLKGKKILDVGCGEGEDGMILAKLGAQVTGLDVSPGAIELAKARAKLNGVSENVNFVCAPLDATTLPEHSFDVIWIDNVLHHVLDDLENVMRSLLKAAKPGALIICIEPFSLIKTLRKIRFLVPVHTEVTPGERPLEKHDLAVLEKVMPGMKRRHFNFLGRLVRFVIPGYRYETAPFWRRKLTDAIRVFDYALLAVPGFGGLGGIGLVYARVP